MQLEMKHLRISLLSLAIIIVSVLIVLKTQQQPTFKVGDTIRINSHEDKAGQALQKDNVGLNHVIWEKEDLYDKVGEIVGTYEYNNPHETNLHTGYLVSFRNDDVEYDESDVFTLVKHK